MFVLCRHSEYRVKSSQSEESQKEVTAFFGSAHSGRYSSSHLQQKAITAALIQDLIIDSSLPISMVEGEPFRHFMSVVDNRYNPPARSTVTSHLATMAEGVRQQLSDKLATVRSVNLTLDIWSDRKMRAYLGVTAHYILPAKSELSSSLLTCSRFTGSHTGERIAAELGSTLDVYNIKYKVDYVITDNAANMKKAMSIALYDTENSEEADPDEAAIDNPDIWKDIDETDKQEILETVNAHSRKERLACFNHTLHLVVGDGLKDTKCVSSALAKCSKITSMIHTSSLFRDAFEQAFGRNKSIPSAVVTRWNSTLRQIKSVLSLDMKLLCEVLEAQGQKHLVFAAREWSQLNELVDVLDPFLEATLLTEGDKQVTISYALPSVLALIKHVRDVRHRVKYCNPICFALLASLSSRFDRLLQRVQVTKEHRVSDVSSLPFGSDAYIISTVLDPKFRLKWIDNELDLDAEGKEDLRRELTGMGRSCCFWSTCTHVVCSVNDTLCK